MNDPANIKQTYRRFAERESRGYSDLYERLAFAAAENDDVVRFIAEMPVIQPNLFFASIQFLTGPDDMPQTAPDLSAFVKQHGADLSNVMRTHRTQTNEVGRCAVLLPALPPGPLAIVEVGASAGLNLLLDQFHYEFRSREIGSSSSLVHLQCAVDGPVPLPAAIPHIAWRHGLDLHPIDVRNDDAVRWLLACVWADHPERRRRLEGAIALARSAPPSVSAGDLVDDLPTLVAKAPENAQLVVFHSAVLSYVTPERRQTFADMLAEISKQRDVVWISNEARGVVAEFTALAPAMRAVRFLLGRTRFTNGRREDELLAIAHPHGADLIWL